jgi:Tat protein secretion system quality control protein TatD with DNase activity
MELMDTHTHLYVEAFDEDLSLVIERASGSQVYSIFLFQQ